MQAMAPGKTFCLISSMIPEEYRPSSEMGMMSTVFVGSTVIRAVVFLPHSASEAVVGSSRCLFEHNLSLVCGGRLEVAAEFDEPDNVPFAQELDYVHEPPHEGNASAARLAEVLVGGAIGDGGRVETGSLVGHGDFGFLRVNPVGDGDFLPAIPFVAVLDSVDKGFVDCEANGEEVPLRVTQFP